MVGDTAELRDGAVELPGSHVEVAERIDGAPVVRLAFHEAHVLSDGSVEPALPEQFFCSLEGGVAIYGHGMVRRINVTQQACANVLMTIDAHPWVSLGRRMGLAGSAGRTRRQARGNAMVEQLHEDETVIDPRLRQELWRHRGQWAAIKGNRVVAFGSTPKQVLRRALRKGVSDVVLHRVPEDGENSYLL